MNCIKTISLLPLILFVIVITTNAQSTNEGNQQPKKSFMGRLKDNVVTRAQNAANRFDSVANARINNAVKVKMDNVFGKDSSVAATPSNVNNTNTQNSTGENHLPDNHAQASNTTKAPLNSELNYAALNQSKARPLKEGYTRLRIARNLALDVKGSYPTGYQPKWRFISYNSPLNFKKDDWIFPSSTRKSESFNLSIGDYKGKAVLRIKMYSLCECFADVVITDSLAVINQTPQTFKVTHFQKILNDRATGEACQSTFSNNTQGGSEGMITLSANEAGDIVMSLTIENYTGDQTKRGKYNNAKREWDYYVVPSKLAYKYYAENITIDNEMTAEKANDIIAKEQEAKQKQKDYIAKMTKQSDSLQKLIANKYPGAGCKDCFVRNSNSSLRATPTSTVYTNSYGDVVDVQSGTDWDVNTKTSIKNTCNYPITFIGIQQLYNAEKGYYLEEVTKTMEAGYNYSSDQGLMSSIFTSFIGGGSEFNVAIQDRYAVNYARVGSVQWLKVVKGN